MGRSDALATVLRAWRGHLRKEKPRRPHAKQTARNCAVDRDREEPLDRRKGSDHARYTNPCWKIAARALKHAPTKSASRRGHDDRTAAFAPFHREAMHASTSLLQAPRDVDLAR